MKRTTIKYLMVLGSVWFAVFVYFLGYELVYDVLDVDSFSDGLDSFIYILFTFIIAFWIHFLGAKIYKRLGL